MGTSTGITSATIVKSRTRCFPWPGRRRRPIVVLVTVLAMLIPLGALAAVVIGLALVGRDVSKTLRLPAWLETRIQRDEIAYPAHVVLARGFGLFRVSPLAEGLQWLRAAAHARSDDQIRTAGEGLRSVLARTETARHEQTTELLCQAATRAGRPAHSMVIALAGMDCPIELGVRGHVPQGQPIYYQRNPPSGGPHYGSPHPTYGVVQASVAPGHWVHNLEHGAVVILYRCDGPCPDLIDGLGGLYASLPPNRNSPSGRPRLLAVPHPGLPAPLAMVAWGESVLLDRFDAEGIRDFYDRTIDRGPECRTLRCPE